MSVRKLKALGYPQYEAVDPNDETHFRKVIVWLEDQKIRQLPIEAREPLRQIESNAWQAAFTEYLKSINCPISADSERRAMLDWMLGFAVHLEYCDDKQRYDQATTVKAAQSKTVQSNNPLDNLDFHSSSFKQNVEDLAKTLKIIPHSDHLITLKAISRLVQDRLSNAALKEAESSKSSIDNTGATHDYTTGYKSGDPVFDEAVLGLRLLHVHEMRQLQTRINETIVAVQNLTADPRTDDRLGKVGF